MQNHSSEQVGTAVLDNDRLLSVDELAELAGVTTRTVYLWNHTGRGPRYMKLGRNARYRVSDVVAWMNARYVDEGGITTDDN